MKKARLIAAAFLAMIIFFALCGPAWAGYTTTQLTHRGPGSGETYYGGCNAQINDSGQVVWSGWNGSDQRIFLYSGGVTTQLPNSFNGNDPQINNYGQVVWQGYNDITSNYSEIFLYSGGVTTQLPNSSNDFGPQINNSGQVVWQGAGGSGSGSDQGIYLYSGGVTTQLTNNGGNPQINDAGQVIWEGWDGYDVEIYLYSGGVTTRLPNSFNGHFPQINDSGQVVWQDSAGADNIYLYSGGVTTEIAYNGTYPQINDSGQVVWTGHNGSDGSDQRIFLYSGGVTTQLPNSFNGNDPQINNSGQVVWQGYSGITSNDPEIFLCSGGVTTQLTNNGGNPQINDSGQVVWTGQSGDLLNIWAAHYLNIFLASQCDGSRPTLALSRGNAFWASYADYTARELSATMTVSNPGTFSANHVQIIGSTNTNGVALFSAVPAPVGDIAGGASNSITVKYHVPAGVGSFRTSVYATAQDSCGMTYSYPVPYPGS